MSRLFISHSSKNDAWAIALKDWLVGKGWSGPDDIFLDLDPERGIAAGQRWTHALNEAATRCEAVLFLVSEDWLSSKWCNDEYQLANKLNKKLFALLIDDVALDRLPGGLTAQWQIVRLKGEPAERFVVEHPVTRQQTPVHISEAGLTSLRRGLEKAGIGTETFELQPDPNGPFGWRAPYRGLEALEPEDAAVFFGRSADIVRGIDALRGLAAQPPPRLLVILGSSGAGKSSYLRAGLWPRLNRDDGQWMPLRAIRAGRGGALEGSEGLLSAVEDLYRRFAQRVSRADLRERLATADAFVVLLRELREIAARRALISGPPFPLPVICLDQGEEVFAADPPPESTKFLELARGAIDADAALLLVTIRSDSYGSMQSADALKGVAQVPSSLGPVPHGEIAEVIRRPAEILRKKVGPTALVFDAALVERLQTEMEGEDDALPLLAFVMQRLMREHEGAVTIGIAELERTGGVAAAIESAAEAALTDAGFGPDHAARRQVLRRLFIPRLARIDRISKTPHRRSARQSELPADLRALAAALTQRRLLVVKLAAQKEGAPSTATLEVAHEALLRRWPTLADLLAEDRDALLLLDGVLSAAADWEKGDAARKPDFLAHHGSRLSDALALSARGPDWERELAPARAYLAACQAREAAERQAEQDRLVRERRNLRRVRWALVAFALAVSAMLGSVLWGTYRNGQREAVIFESDSASASKQSLCDRALRLAVAGLPPQRGAFFLNFRLGELQNALASEASGTLCPFRMAFSDYDDQKLSADDAMLAVKTAAFSPDGTRIVTASIDGTARVWDTSTGALVANLKLVPIPLRSAQFSPDGKWIVTVGQTDSTGRIWDATTGAQLFMLVGHTGNLTSAVYSADGNRILTASSDHTARLWDAATGAPLVTFTGHSDTVNSALFSPDGSRVVTASADNTARIWDAKTGATIVPPLTGHTAEIFKASFSVDGSRVISASADHTARVWDAATGASLLTISDPTPVYDAEFSPDGTLIATASGDGSVHLWDAKTGAPYVTFSGHSGRVQSVVFSPDGALLVTASSDDTARLWDVRYRTPLGALAGHTKVVNTAVFSSDGRFVVTASDDMSARLWSVTAMTGLHQMRISSPTGKAPVEVFGMSFSPDSNRIVVTSSDKVARVWDVATGSLLLTLTGHSGAVFSAAYSPDGKRIVTASADKTAIIWDASSGQPQRTLSGHLAAVGSAAFSPDGNRVLTTSADQSARVWDAATGNPIFTFGTPAVPTPLTPNLDTTQYIPVDGAAYSPDGTRIVAKFGGMHLWDAMTGAMIAALPGNWGNPYSGDAEFKNAYFSGNSGRLLTNNSFAVQVWDGKTGKPIALMEEPPPSRENLILDAVLSPDGSRVVIATYGGNSQVWDATTGQMLATLAGHTGNVTAAAFNSDGSRIVTSSRDNTMRIWDAAGGISLQTIPWSGEGKFSPDGKLVATTFITWPLDPIVLMAPTDRVAYVCASRLTGAQSFSDAEMQDPILRGRNDLRIPCDRVGPLSLGYYRSPALAAASRAMIAGVGALFVAVPPAAAATITALVGASSVMPPPSQDEDAASKACDQDVTGGNYDAAVTACGRALAFGSKDESIYRDRCSANEHLKNYAAAIADCNRAIALNDDDEQAYLLRAEAYQGSKDYADAITDLDYVVKLNPNDAEALDDRCYAYALAGRLQDALSDCNRSLQWQPDSASALYDRGFTYLKLGRFPDAIANFTAALKVNPKLADALYSRGIAELRNGDAASGNADIAAAKAIEPDIAGVMADLGVK